MSQNRKPPAFQEYAATLLSSVDFRLSTLEERGLWWTLRLECWENDSLPSSPDQLAVLLGLDEDQVARALPRLLRAAIQEANGSLRCHELDDYKQHLVARRQRQSDGGKEGAAIVNQRRSSGKSATNPAGNSPGSGRVLSTVQHSSVQISSDQQSKGLTVEGDKDYPSLDDPAW